MAWNEPLKVSVPVAAEPMPGTSVAPVRVPEIEVLDIAVIVSVPPEVVHEVTSPPANPPTVIEALERPSVPRVNLSPALRAVPGVIIRMNVFESATAGLLTLAPTLIWPDAVR